MAQSPQHNFASPEALALGYEPEALRVRGIAIFIVLFFAALVGVHLLLWQVMLRFERGAAEGDLPRSIVNGSNMRPPPPVLQPSVSHDNGPKQDLEELRHREDAVFVKFGWQVNPRTHEVGIPENVVRKVAEQTRARAARGDTPPTTTGKDHNSILPGTQPASEGGRP